MRNIRLALVVIALGAVALVQPREASASEVESFGFCARCVDGYGCGLEEALCSSWGCTVGMATCGELGACSGAQRLIVCNDYES